MKRPNPAKLAQECETFNKAVPVGSPVTVTKDMGEVVYTKTRSAAWVMGGHSAMILLDGIVGGYRLDRVTPLREGNESR